MPRTMRPGNCSRRSRRVRRPPRSPDPSGGAGPSACLRPVGRSRRRGPSNANTPGSGQVSLPTMYERHFGLKQRPFSIAPDPRYLFMSERHREALAHLLYGVQGGGGFVLLTGDVGAGKTTVCRCFLEQLPERCNVAYIFNPKLTVEELLRTVCAELRIPYPHEGPGVADRQGLRRRAERVPAAHARRAAEHRADHRRSTEPVGPCAGAAAPSDQPRDQ